MIYLLYFITVLSPGAEDSMLKAGVNMHYLCDWWDVLAIAESGSYFTSNEIESVRQFLSDPQGWSAANGGK